MWWFLSLIHASYCSTIAGTRPHFPAVYTCPPSIDIASASFSYRIIETTDNQHIKRDERHKMEPKILPDSHVFIQECFTIIFFKQSSTVRAFWHSMEVPSSLILLMLHKSHLAVSAWPTAHHLMAVDAALEACSGNWSKTQEWAVSVCLLVNVCCLMCLYTNVCVLSAYVYSTFLKGTDDAHVFGTQIQEGICVCGHLHQIHCWVLEHQVFGRCIGFRGEEVKALKRQKRKFIMWALKYIVGQLKHELHV